MVSSSSPRFFRRPSTVAEARVLEKLRLLDHLAAKNFPVRGAGHGEIHVFAVAGKIRPIGSDVMMAHADARRLFAGVPIVMRKIAEPGDDRIEHGNVDQLPLAGLFSLIKRQQNTDRRVHARGDIGDGDAGARGLVRIAGRRDDTALALNQQIVSLDVPIWPVLAVAGKRAIDQPRIDLAQFFIAKTQSPRDAGSVVLEKDIRRASPGPGEWLVLFLF